MKKTLLTERFQELAGIKPLYEAPAKYDDVKSKVLDIINNMSPDEKQNLDNQSIYNIISKVEASTKEYLFGDESDDLEAEIVRMLSGKSQGDDEEVKVVGTDNVDSRNTILRLSNGSFVEVDVIGLYQNLKDNQDLSEDYSKGNELEVVDTDNRDSQYTVLHLSNNDYVEVNVVDLYQNMKDNQ